MKLFLDNIPMGDVPGPQTKPGEFFPRLVGFVVRSANAVSCDGNYWIDVEPIYVPLLRISRRAGQVLIEINSKERPLAYITLQSRKPYVHLFRFDWNSLEGE